MKTAFYGENMNISPQLSVIAIPSLLLSLIGWTNVAHADTYSVVVRNETASQVTLDITYNIKEDGNSWYEHENVPLEPKTSLVLMEIPFPGNSTNQHELFYIQKSDGETVCDGKSPNAIGAQSCRDKIHTIKDSGVDHSATLDFDSPLFSPSTDQYTSIIFNKTNQTKNFSPMYWTSVGTSNQNEGSFRVGPRMNALSSYAAYVYTYPKNTFALGKLTVGDMNAWCSGSGSCMYSMDYVIQSQDVLARPPEKRPELSSPAIH